MWIQNGFMILETGWKILDITIRYTVQAIFFFMSLKLWDLKVSGGNRQSL